MSKWAPTTFYDAAFAEVTKANLMVVCSAQPTTRAEAVTTYKLADVAVDSGDFSLGAGTPSGRKCTVAAQSAVPIDTTGTATHVALVDGTDLLYVNTCTSQALTSGNTVDIPSWTINLDAPT